MEASIIRTPPGKPTMHCPRPTPLIPFPSTSEPHPALLTGQAQTMALHRSLSVAGPSPKSAKPAAHAVPASTESFHSTPLYT